MYMTFFEFMTLLALFNTPVLTGMLLAYDVIRRARQWISAIHWLLSCHQWFDPRHIVHCLILKFRRKLLQSWDFFLTILKIRMQIPLYDVKNQFNPIILSLALELKSCWWLSVTRLKKKVMVCSNCIGLKCCWSQIILLTYRLGFFELFASLILWLRRQIC